VGFTLWGVRGKTNPQLPPKLPPRGTRNAQSGGTAFKQSAARKAYADEIALANVRDGRMIVANGLLRVLNRSGTAGDKAAATWDADEIRTLKPGFSSRGWLETYPMTDVMQKQKLVKALAELRFERKCNFGQAGEYRQHHGHLQRLECAPPNRAAKD